MYFRSKINTDSLRQFAKGLHDDINYTKVLEAFSSGLHTRIKDQQGKRYTYGTPTIGYSEKASIGGYGRKNLRSRSGRLMKALESARFTKQKNKNQWEAGYDVRTILSIAPYAKYHLNYDVNGKVVYTKLTPKGRTYFYIPLKAAQNADGTQKIAAPLFTSYTVAKEKGKSRFRKDYKEIEADPSKGRRYTSAAQNFTRNTVKKFKALDDDRWTRAIYSDVKDTADFSGEDQRRFKPYSILIMRDNKPYFVLAKKIRLPNRLTLAKELNEGVNGDRYFSLRARLQTEVNRLIRKLAR